MVWRTVSSLRDRSLYLRMVDGQEVVGRLSQCLFRCLGHVTWKNVTLVTWLLDDVDVERSWKWRLGVRSLVYFRVVWVICMTLPNDHRLPFRPELWQALQSGFGGLPHVRFRVRVLKPWIASFPGTLIFDMEKSCTESHECWKQLQSFLATPLPSLEGAEPFFFVYRKVTSIRLTEQCSQYGRVLVKINSNCQGGTVTLWCAVEQSMSTSSI